MEFVSGEEKRREEKRREEKRLNTFTFASETVESSN
jgi:hypothetical protein